MEISTDPDGTVYVRRHGGGPWTVLHPDGTVTSEVGLGGREEWDSGEQYEAGWEAGHAEGVEEGRTQGAAEEAKRQAAEKAKAAKASAKAGA